MSVLVKVLLNVHHHFVLYVVLYVVRDEKIRDSRKYLCKQDRQQVKTGFGYSFYSVCGVGVKPKPHIC